MTRISSLRHGLVKAIQQFLPSQFFSHLKVGRSTHWRPQRIVFVALLLMWDAEKALTDRFAAALGVVRALFPRWRLGASYQGWCDAQLQYLGAIQPALARRLRQQMQGFAGRHWQREGWCAFAADGSRVECPRTAANQEGLPRAGRMKTGPQLFLTALWHMGTGLPWDYRIGPGTASERKHLKEMLNDLPARSLIVADAGFTGYELLQGILQTRHSFLIRVGNNVRLLRELGYVEWQDASTVYLWPQKLQKDQAPVVLRLIVLQRGKEQMHLLTDVFDTQALSQQQAAVLYEMRWGVEVFYRSCKQTMDRRRMLSRTPPTCKAELHWVVLSIWLLGVMTVSAVIERGGDPLSWSVALARKRVRAAMRAVRNRRRACADVRAGLASAVKDGYQRSGSKKARDWPHKKKEKPPGAPKIRPANTQEIQNAQRLRQRDQL